jgi:hypothetical protein
LQWTARSEPDDYRQKATIGDTFSFRLSSHDVLIVVRPIQSRTVPNEVVTAPRASTANAAFVTVASLPFSRIWKVQIVIGNNTTMTTHTPSIVSVGRAASQLICAPAFVTQAASELDIAPAMTINGIPHFSESDLVAIGERVRTLQSRRRKK